MRTPPTPSDLPEGPNAGSNLHDDLLEALRSTCRVHEVIGSCPACERRLAALLPVVQREIDGRNAEITKVRDREEKLGQAALAEAAQVNELRSRFRALAEGRTGQIHGPNWSWPSAIHAILDDLKGPHHKCPFCGAAVPGTNEDDLCQRCDLQLANDVAREYRQAIQRVRELGEGWSRLPAEALYGDEEKADVLRFAGKTVVAALDQPAATPTKPPTQALDEAFQED